MRHTDTWAGGTVEVWSVTTSAI